MQLWYSLINYTIVLQRFSFVILCSVISLHEGWRLATERKEQREDTYPLGYVCVRAFFLIFSKALAVL